MKPLQLNGTDAYGTGFWIVDARLHLRSRLEFSRRYM